jgi:hypothetical protein
LNDTKIADKKFILEDLDATHLLIKGEVREEITRKVEEWMDEVSLCSTYDDVGLFIRSMFLLSLFGFFMAECIFYCRKSRRKSGQLIGSKGWKKQLQ